MNDFQGRIDCPYCSVLSVFEVCASSPLLCVHDVVWLHICVPLEFSSEEVYMESSGTVMSSSASKSVRFESSSVQSASEETGGVSNVFKLTRSTSADGRPVFTKTIEGSNLERKWVTLHLQWKVSDLHKTTVLCFILFVCGCILTVLMGKASTFSLTV